MNNTETREVTQVNAETLIAQAINEKLPVETMEKLLAMRRELKAEVARENFFIALAAFQADCPTIQKTKSVIVKGEVRYKYAPLESIVDQVKENLRKHGFSYTLKARQTPKDFTAICEAHHQDGHTETTEFSIPIATDNFMNDSQKVGSANTYAKRYAFCNAFGIMTGDEDFDGDSDIGEPVGDVIRGHAEEPQYSQPTTAGKPAASGKPVDDRPPMKVCKQCGVQAVIKSKYGAPGWVCWDKKGGCGHKYQPDAYQEKEQELVF